MRPQVPERQGLRQVRTRTWASELLGPEAPGKVCALGTEVDVGAGGFGAGTCAFVTATVVTRFCARLRSVLRWLTRRLDVLARAAGRVAVAVVGGTQSRYTSIVAKECWGSGLSVPRVNIGREQSCRSSKRRISPCAVCAVREDGVPWVILFIVCCEHRHGERVRGCPTSGHHHGRRRRRILRHRAVSADRWPCADELHQ